MDTGRCIRMCARVYFSTQVHIYICVENFLHIEKTKGMREFVDLMKIRAKMRTQVIKNSHL